MVKTEKIIVPEQAVPKQQIKRQPKKKRKTSKYALRRKTYKSANPEDNQAYQQNLQYVNSKICEICHQKGDEDLLLLCDRCDDAYHTTCLDPPLLELPEEQWLCPECNKQQELLALKAAQNIREEEKCFACKKSLLVSQKIKGWQKDKEVQLQSQMLSTNLVCLKCSHKFHNACFSARKNSLNCASCQKQIRRYMPKSHDQWMKFIQKCQSSIENNLDFKLLNNFAQPIITTKHRLFRLKVPAYMTNWMSIVRYQASLYYAFVTKNICFSDQQIYNSKRFGQCLQLNSPKNDINQVIRMLDDKDQAVYQQFKINSKKGYVGPFQVKQDRIKGFFLIATDYIEPYTIVSEYVGEVRTSRHSLQTVDFDSIFSLIMGRNAKTSLDIVPQAYGNISRFFSGINNSNKRFNKLENIKSLRFNYKGRVRVLLYTFKPVQAGQTLYFDYNGSLHQYPTDHFVQ